MYVLFPLTCVTVLFYGVSILAGSLPSVDFTQQPKWLGYFLLYAGFIMLVMFMIDLVITPNLKHIKKSPVGRWFVTKSANPPKVD